ncbi:META domain-containing protein [Bacteroidota bacterium]
MKKDIKYLVTVFLITITVISCEKIDDNLDPNKLQAVWDLYQLIDKETNVTLDTPEIKISFLGNNCVTVFGTCNHGTGNFSIDGHKVTVSDLVLIERCGSESERSFIANLSGSYLVDEDTLRILSTNNADLVLYKSQITDSYQCDLTTMLIDTIESKRYYTEDIFNTNYSSIYGKWYVYNAHGGWVGADLVPYFDFFEVKRNGIYGFSKDYTLLEYGRIQIEKQTDEELRLKLIPDINSESYLGANNIKVVDFSGSDTIVIYDRCLDCYQHSLSRIR